MNVSQSINKKTLILVLFAVLLLLMGACGPQGGGYASAQDAFKEGNRHYQTGDIDQAIAAYKQAIEINPDFQAAYVNLGVAYYQQEQFELAEAQYVKALELNPDDGDVAYNLGALYLQQAIRKGEPFDETSLEQALTQLEKARDLTPHLAEPYFSLGVAYRLLGENEEAQQAFEAFLEREPQDQRAIQEARLYLDALEAEQ